jgi:signal transduction histidine kinase
MVTSINIFTNLLLPKKDDPAFNLYYLKNSVKGIRVGLALGIFLFIAFGFIVDTMFVQWALRLGLIVPTLACALILTYTRFFYSFAQVILASTYFLVSVGIIVMIYYTPNYASRDVYSTGLALVFFGAGVLRMRTTANLMTTPIIIGVYLLLFFNNKELLIHIPLLVSASLLALITTTNVIGTMRENFKTLKVLKTEREKLEEADNLKSKLISFISHDLKSPMNNVLSLMRLYNSNAVTGEELDKLFREIEKRVRGSKEMLEDLLTWSAYKIKGKAETVPVNMREEIERLMFTLVEPAAAKHNLIVNNVPDCRIQVDHKLAVMVVRNLINNAIKFTTNGMIVVNGECSSRGIQLSIMDTGVGIAEDVMPRLFDWNHRFTSLGTAGEKGTGLGLLICRDFLEGIGGSITVESQRGIGTQFQIFIPANVMAQEKELEMCYQ